MASVSCRQYEHEYPDTPEVSVSEEMTLREVARILSTLPLGKGNLDEVYDAVGSSAGNGYDEEYMMSDLFSCPGAGVGSGGRSTRAEAYGTPLRDLFADYFSDRCATRSGASVDEYIAALEKSDIQIYWPYSCDWDGESYPIITFDPGFGAESNYGYEISLGEDGIRIVDSVYVDESVAMTRPVWVVNRNDDSAFSPLEMFRGPTEDYFSAPAAEETRRTLMIKSFEMLRNYDSWFGGASEFFVKCGAVDGFKATTDEDLKKYSPTVTDFMISVKRSQIKTKLPFEAILLTDFTEQIDKLVFLIVEDDGGTTTTWKASASVKFKSKAYGFDVEIPYKDKDDIVWRGQLASTFFTETKEVTGRFGDVRITFAVK